MGEVGIGESCFFGAEEERDGAAVELIMDERNGAGK